MVKNPKKTYFNNNKYFSFAQWLKRDESSIIKQIAIIIKEKGMDTGFNFFVSTMPSHEYDYSNYSNSTIVYLLFHNFYRYKGKRNISFCRKLFKALFGYTVSKKKKVKKVKKQFTKEEQEKIRRIKHIIKINKQEVELYYQVEKNKEGKPVFYQQARNLESGRFEKVPEKYKVEGYEKE